jgi:hypothetical protein
MITIQQGLYSNELTVIYPYSSILLSSSVMKAIPVEINSLIVVE